MSDIFLNFRIGSDTENVEMDYIAIENKMHSDGCVDVLFWYGSINLQCYSDTHEKETRMKKYVFISNDISHRKEFISFP